MAFRWVIQPKPTPGKEQLVKAVEHRVAILRRKINDAIWNGRPVAKMREEVTELEKEKSVMMILPPFNQDFPSFFPALDIELVSDFPTSIRDRFYMPKTPRELKALGERMLVEHNVWRDHYNLEDWRLIYNAGTWCVFWANQGHGMLPKY